jgi:hypothetical protein
MHGCIYCSAPIPEDLDICEDCAYAEEEDVDYDFDVDTDPETGFDNLWDTY